MQNRPPLFLKIVSSQANIRNMFFDQRSSRHPEVGVGPKLYVLEISEKGTPRGKKGPRLFFKIVSSQANIRNRFFDQRSPRHPEVGVGPKLYGLAISEKGTQRCKNRPPLFLKIVSSQANIRNTFFDQQLAALGAGHISKLPWTNTSVLNAVWLARKKLK